MSEDERDDSDRRREKFYTERRPPPPGSGREINRDLESKSGRFAGAGAPTQGGHQWRERLPPPVGSHGQSAPYPGGMRSRGDGALLSLFDRPPPSYERDYSPPRPYHLPPPLPSHYQERGMSPPMKRARMCTPPPEYSRSGGLDLPYHGRKQGPSSLGSQDDKKNVNQDKEGFQPVMMSFKAFLETQHDLITDEEALVKYSEYKMEFKRQQLNEFFVSHRGEEWFRLKYHPVESATRKAQHQLRIEKRLEVYSKLKSEGRLDHIALEEDKADELARLMDHFVIRLEGGSDEDIKAFDGLGGTASDSSDKPSAPEPCEAQSMPEGQDSEEKEQTSEDANTEKKIATPRTTSLFLKAIPPSITYDKLKEICSRYPGFVRLSLAEPTWTMVPPPNSLGGQAKPTFRWSRRGWVTFQRDAKIREICFNLHNSSGAVMTCSGDASAGSKGGANKDTAINLGPVVVNKDLSKRVRSSGLLADDENSNEGDKGTTARKSLHDVRILRNDIRLAAKLIGMLDARWNLWGNKSKPETTTKAELKQEDEPSKEKAENEEKAREKSPNTTKQEETIQDLSLPMMNPLMANLHDYLVEEVDAEESQLLGAGYNQHDASNVRESECVDNSRVEELCRVLDQLLIYLRLVHSIDYYNRSGPEYTAEDEMPNRCGILHVRETVAGEDTEEAGSSLSDKMVAHHNAEIEKIIQKAILKAKIQLTEAEAACLGLKTEADEIEKFIMANCQELAKDKWLCPLSGKKFKGPEFVRKHIFNKFPDKVEEVKLEAQFFNNYLRDPCRPEQPEVPAKQKKKAQAKKMTDMAPEDHHERREAPVPPPPRRKLPVKERLGYHPILGSGGGGVRVTQAGSDPRQVVDYSDMDWMSAADIF